MPIGDTLDLRIYDYVCVLLIMLMSLRAINASTMESTSNVLEFLDTLSDNLRDRARADFDQMLAMKKLEDPTSERLDCWDAPYFGLKAKQAWLKVANSEYSPYFSLGGCMEGFNLLLQTLYGISLQNEEMGPGENRMRVKFYTNIRVVIMKLTLLR